MNRKEKIALFKGIAAGTRSISEIKPVEVNFWTIKEGIYNLHGSKVKLTEQQFFDFELKQGKNVLNFCSGEIDNLIPIVNKEKGTSI